MEHPHPRAIWSLSVAGNDLSDKINPRLVMLTITEQRDDEADQISVELSDTDGALAIPALGAEITASIGWKHSGLIDKGLYIVDEVEYSGAPDVLILRGRSADLTGNLRIRTERSFNKKTIDEIVGEIAGANGLEPVVAPSLGSTLIEHIDQTSESDAAFLRRLGKRHDAVATIKEGRLLFIPIQGAKKPDDATEMPEFEIERRHGDMHSYQESARDTYTGVRAYWNDTRAAKKKDVVVGVVGNAKKLPEVYASEEDALEAASAEWKRLRRGKATMSFNLAVAKPDIVPQCLITFKDMKPPIGGQRWLIKKLTNQLNPESGLTTQLEMETEG